MSNKIEIDENKISETIEYINNKFNSYQEFLGDKFYYVLSNELKRLLKKFNNELSDIDMHFLAEQIVIKKLCSLVTNEDNVECLLMLTEDYTRVTSYILKKKNIKLNIEDIIYNAIETYEGDKMFSSHILDTVKIMNNEKVEKHL